MSECSGLTSSAKNNDVLLALHHYLIGHNKEVFLVGEVQDVLDTLLALDLTCLGGEAGVGGVGVWERQTEHSVREKQNATEPFHLVKSHPRSCKAATCPAQRDLYPLLTRPSGSFTPRNTNQIEKLVY